MRKIPPKTDRKTIESNFDDMYDTGFLTGMETNSNFIEFTYLMKYDGVTIIKDGVEYGLHNVGKLSKIVTNIETVRTVCSKKRKERKLKLDMEAKEQFKKEYGIDKPDVAS